MQFLSTPSARRATFLFSGGDPIERISIHALCEEGDRCARGMSIHLHDFYPRPLRGGRQAGLRRSSAPLHISIHALCEEGDLSVAYQKAIAGNFYPRPLRGGRPVTNPAAFTGGRISIHALCEEGDPVQVGGKHGTHDFYPRPLRGGRHGRAGGVLLLDLFLSTPSARRATWQGGCDYNLQLISIHALCEEGDISPFSGTTSCCNFYPRPLRGGRPFFKIACSPRFAFLSTPSARRATRCLDIVMLRHHFYPRPLRGGRPGCSGPF